MRAKIFASLVLSMFSGVALANAPLVVPSPADRVYIPNGFDDNDNVEVFVNGLFPDSCYKTATSAMKLEGDTITLRVQSFRYEGDFCAEMMVPFVQTVTIGLLPAGTYKVVVEGRPDIATRELEVARSNRAGPDDYTYAPVANANVQSQNDGSRLVTLEGTYPHMLVGCMRMTHVRAVLSADNVLVLQPISELFYDSTCRNQDHNFKVNLRMNINMPEGSYFMHVRTLNGNSFNRLVNIAR